MLLQVQKEQIIDGLQKAASIIPAKSGAAYLRSLWLKAEGDSLTIMATDANIEFTGLYEAKVSDPGMVGVNGRNFVDLVRRLPEGELRLRLDDKSGAFVVEQGRRNYRLPVSDVTWFQPLAAFVGFDFVSVVWRNHNNLISVVYCTFHPVEHAKMLQSPAIPHISVV